VRESLFSSLEFLLEDFADVHVLDLYAGAGSLGLEALSRGAASVCFVERDRRTADVLERNIAAVGLPGATIVRTDVAQLASRSAAVPAGLVLADPPYDVPATDVARVLVSLAGTGWVAAEALCVIERPSRDPQSPWPRGWSDLRRRDYGETALWYGRTLLEPESDGR
jgi:16S rRNA (guanine(966)-N(2))-methyltransferase RsmD